MTLPLSEYLPLYLGTDLIAQFSVDQDLYYFVLQEVLFDYPAEDESECTDLKKLYNLGKMHLWKTLMIRQSSAYDFSADGSSYKPSQLYEFCKQNYLNAVTDCVDYLKEIPIDQYHIHKRRHNEEFSY